MLVSAGLLKRTNYKQSKIAMMIKISSDSMKSAIAEAAAHGGDISEKISSSEGDLSLKKFAASEDKL